MKQAKILIIDDESIMRMDIREMLEEEGYNVVGEGKNGEEAIERAYELQPDLIIMDVKMPRMDGIKAASIIKSFSNCSVLLLTAFSRRELIEDAKKAEINAYLVKPVKEKELLPAVEIALTQRAQFLALRKKVSELERKIAERKTIEKAKGILIKKLSCSEDQAYRWLQRKSMEKQASLITIAEKVIQQTSE
jgi:AmiR/NasT family two-component response regulator